ncbi:MAG TPA: ketopantoate reductase family protein, partial [Chloroflexi bacterium]|nr:ketopantoate reductase family protein [Chloroflexota bacterium]
PVNVLVVGSGAIGSLVGNRLARTGHDVTLVGRPGYVEAVRERGVGVEEGGQRVYANVRAVAQFNPASMATAPPDVMLFTMKAYDTATAAVQVEPLVRQGVPILVIQNGVGGEEQAARALAKREAEPTIFSAVITLSVEVIQPGLVQLSTSRGGIGLAPIEPGQAVGPLAQIFREAGFRVQEYPDYRASKWSKLLLNMLGNASVAILGWPPDRVFGDARLFALERTAFCEALTVMGALGVRPVGLPGYPVPLLAWAFRALPDRLLRPVLQQIVAGGRGGKMPSLYLDLANRRPRSEVEFLNGAVVEQATRLGIPAPVNEALYTTLTRIVRGEVAWEAYHHRPERLLDAAGWRT